MAEDEITVIEKKNKDGEFKYKNCSFCEMVLKNCHRSHCGVVD